MHRYFALPPRLRDIISCGLPQAIPLISIIMQHAMANRSGTAGCSSTQRAAKSVGKRCGARASCVQALGHAPSSSLSRHAVARACGSLAGCCFDGPAVHVDALAERSPLLVPRAAAAAAAVGSAGLLHARIGSARCRRIEACAIIDQQ